MESLDMKRLWCRDLRLELMFIGCRKGKKLRHRSVMKFILERRLMILPLKARMNFIVRPFCGLNIVPRLGRITWTLDPS